MWISTGRKRVILIIRIVSWPDADRIFLLPQVQNHWFNWVWYQWHSSWLKLEQQEMLTIWFELFTRPLSHRNAINNQSTSAKWYSMLQIPMAPLQFLFRNYSSYNTLKAITVSIRMSFFLSNKIHLILVYWERRKRHVWI